MYLASKIHKELNTQFSADQIIGREFTYGQISRMLNGILRPMGARIRVIRDAELKSPRGSKKQYYSFSGYYDTEKEKNAIMINVHFSSARRKFTFTKSRYNGFIFQFSQTVQHEFIHEAQYEFRPEQSERSVKILHSDKISKERLANIEYLSAWCEIEAYAHDIAMEIKAHYPDSNYSKIISRIDSQRKLYSYLVYKKAFKGTDWDRLKKSLLRKIWRWLPSAQIPVFV